MSNATLGQGTLLQLSDGDSPPIYTTVAEVTSINPDGIQRDSIDVTSHDSLDAAREFIAGLVDGSTISISLNFLPTNVTQTDLTDNLVETDPAEIFRTYRIVWTDYGTKALTGSVNTSTDVWTTSTHGWETCQPIRFTTSGALPTSSPQIVIGNTYFAGVASTTTFKVYRTQADAIADTNAINFTTTGSGTHTVNGSTSWVFSAMVGGFGASSMHNQQLSASPKFKITNSVSIGA